MLTQAQILTIAETAALPAVTDLATAARALGLSRNKAYQLAGAGQFPCPVFRAGNTWKVPTAGLLTLLGLPVPGPAQTPAEHPEPARGRRERPARGTPAKQPAGGLTTHARRPAAATDRRSAR